MTTLLLVLLGIAAGIALGFSGCMISIEKYYPTAWKILTLENKAHKQKRADAARDKEA